MLASAVEAFKEEFGKRLERNYLGATFSVRRVGRYGMSVMSGTTHDKEVIDVMLQETWESADDWFQP
ncbi:MAG: DinI-like family protein [Rouxiella aceris]|uniref:DinI-like family protein n=1 Tax=Rouxiella aceris TaxID=2703884 RepID=UPI002840B8CE|nr:DinI-like family protein [Rouxiella aceris]MDR3431574.1 DinI-like family protein [Rouxiella aceris]